ncbi:MAG: hemolysin family protein [Bacillota bacterium]|nr:hemolysin family protein [Bacillota bacterium]
MLPYIAIIICLFFSALFSGAEIAYASASEVKLRKTNAKRAHNIFVNYETALISILVGNNLVNIASSALATVIAISLLGENGAWLASIIMTIVIIIFGEISPKLIANKNPEGFAKLVAWPISIWMIITKPVVIFANAFVKLVSNLWRKQVVDDAVTEDDLETIFDTIEEEGVVDEETADLFQGTLDFDDTPVYEIITPRVDMMAIDIDDSNEANLEKILKCKFSRLPVYRETPDHIVGMLHTTQVLRDLAAGDDLNIQEMMMEAHFAYKTTPLADVFELMQKTSCHMVIVTDEYGGTMGFVTMEDVLEQLVGEIFDEKDVVDEEFVELSEDKFEVDGDMRLEDFFDELDMDDEEDEIGDDNATIGGWAMEKIEGYPKLGDTFDYKNLHFEITECEEMRVLTLSVIVNDNNQLS